MPLTSFHLLAEGNAVELLWGLVVFGIWAISSVAGIVAKKKEKERRERVRNEISKTVPGQAGVPDWNSGVPQPPVRPTVRNAPVRNTPARNAPVRTVPPPPTVRGPVLRVPPPPYRPAPVKAKKKKRAVPPPLINSPAPVFEVQDTARQVSTFADRTSDVPTVTRSAAGPAPVSATAALLQRWLNAKTLQQQFILTEIIQPPKSLR